MGSQFKLSQAFGREPYLYAVSQRSPYTIAHHPGHIGNQLRSESRKKADGALNITSTKTKLPVDRAALCAGKWAAFCWTQNRQTRPPCVGSVGPWQGPEEPNRTRFPVGSSFLRGLERKGYGGPLPYRRLPHDGRTVFCGEDMEKGVETSAAERSWSRSGVWVGEGSWGQRTNARKMKIKRIKGKIREGEKENREREGGRKESG